MKLSKKVNYKKKSKRNNIKKNKRVSNKNRKPKINKKPKVNRTKKTRVKRGGNQFNILNCATQVIVRKDLKRKMGAPGEWAYSPENHTVKKAPPNLELGEVSVHEPIFYVRCGLQASGETEQETKMTREEFAKVIVDMINNKITSVVSEISLEKLDTYFEQGDDETIKKEKIRALFEKLIDQGIFEEILQEFNKFQDVASLHKIGAEIAIFLRNNRTIFIERLTEAALKLPISQEPSEANSVYENQLNDIISGLLEKEPFFTLSMNDNYNNKNRHVSVSNLKSIFNKQIGGEPVSIVLVSLFGAFLLYKLLKKKNKSGTGPFGL